MNITMEKASMYIFVLALLLPCIEAAGMDLTASSESALESIDNWQADRSSSEALEYLLIHKVGADVTFTVTHDDGPSKGVAIAFNAHKTILAARSSVMADLLADPALQNPVKVTDVDPEAFRQALRYMYTDQPHITQDNVGFVAQAARVYKLPGLQRLCGKFLQQDLTNNPVFNVMKQGVHFGDHDLIASCMEVIATLGPSLLNAPDFVDISMPMLQYIVDIDKINCYEVELFRALMRWAEAECKRQSCGEDKSATRALLQPVIHSIRFPSMSLKEFTEEVVSSGLLTPEEVAMVYRLIISDNPPQESPFISANRGKPLLYPGAFTLDGTVSRHNSFHASASYNSEIECIVNRDVTVHAIYSLQYKYSKNKISIKTDDDARRSHMTTSYTPNITEIDDGNKVILKHSIEGGHKEIKQGRVKLKLIQSSSSIYPLDILEYSSAWQRQGDGSVEWWCSSSGTPFYGLQYTVLPRGEDDD